MRRRGDVKEYAYSCMTESRDFAPYHSTEMFQDLLFFLASWNGQLLACWLGNCIAASTVRRHAYCIDIECFQGPMHQVDKNQYLFGLEHF